MSAIEFCFVAVISIFLSISIMLFMLNLYLNRKDGAK